MNYENNYLIKILYAVKLPPLENRGYSFPNLYDKRFIKLINAFSIISRLQKDMIEIYCTKEVSIRNRMIGFLDGYTISLFDSYDDIKKHPFSIKVVFTDEVPEKNKIEAGTIFVLTSDSTHDVDCHLNLKKITPLTLKNKVMEAVSTMSYAPRIKLNKLRSYVGFESGHSRLETTVSTSDGFYNRINIAVLESLRVDIQIDGISCDFSEKEITKLVNLVNHIRVDISKNLGTKDMRPAVEYYFLDLSSNLDFAKDRNNYTEPTLRNRGIADPRAMVDAIKYSDRGLFDCDEPTNTYIKQLKTERQLLDSLIALSAANHVAPVIKIPLSNSQVISDVRNLASADRSNGKKINALMLKLRNTYAKHIDGWLEYIDSTPSSAIKLISNLPLEWAYHQGLPLMVRHEVSRIPVTPGYVTSRLLLDSNQIHLSLNDFQEILFITSFKDDDPIRDHLKKKLAIIQNNTELKSVQIEALKNRGVIPEEFQIDKKFKKLDVHINWIEVSNKAELIEAINNNPCAVTVFDLHGSHDMEKGGMIHLKDEVVSVFNIYQDIQISPIVILSSCDTSPVDKGHNSTAEAFFMAGAKTVISSALPIDSDLASTFLARLLERIKTYLPIRVATCGAPIRWSTLISGMTRRTYYYELVTLLQEELAFSAQEKADILLKIGMKIDPLSPNWVNSANEEITSLLEINQDFLDEFIAKKAQFLECMKYFQLGRPELILISADRRY